MRLSLQTDYSLRTLMFLAMHGDRHTVEDVSTFFRISTAHVAKVVNDLARRGYIRSIRGIGGGLELAKPATAITIGEIVQAVEGNVHLLECLGLEDVCVIQRHCKLRTVLGHAERLQQQYLNSVTLADVLPFQPAPPTGSRTSRLTGKKPTAAAESKLATGRKKTIKRSPKSKNV